MNAQPDQDRQPGADDDPLASFAALGREIEPSIDEREDSPPIYRVTPRAEPKTASRPVGTHGSHSDPTFGYLLAAALSIGLTPLLPYSSDLRLVITWSVLAAISVLTWLLGSMDRIGEEAPEDLVWGMVFGLILATPLLLVGGDALTTTVRLIFRTGIEGSIRALPPGSVFALIVFVMPLAETLFFRGLMQKDRSFGLVGALASVWSMLLFFPLIEVGRFPAVAIIIGTALTLMNMIYSYVRDRNGLAAAWLCQIVVNLLVMFVPYITS